MCKRFCNAEEAITVLYAARQLDFKHAPFLLQVYRPRRVECDPALLRIAKDFFSYVNVLTHNDCAAKIEHVF